MFDTDSPMDLQDLNPATNPDVQQALSWRYSNCTVLIVPLLSGRFAIFGRDGILHTIMDEAPTGQELRDLSSAFQQKLQSRTAEARFYGEPQDRDTARDLKRARAPERPKRQSIEALALDIDL